jgi:uncharacterized RDD family membrane protein YckC
MRNVHVITTPENVEFEFELAGVAIRALAWTIDLMVLIVLITTVACGLSMLTPLLGGIAEALIFLAIFLIQWGYATLLEWRWRGQTVGKRVLGLRVLSEHGVPIDFMASAIRNLVRTIDSLPVFYLVGGVSSLIDKRGRRLGDLAAGTIVVRERRAPKPASVVPASERHNSFIVDPSVVHAVRRITPPERDAMIGLGLRRETLPLHVRQDLFARLSKHLEARLGIHRPSFFSEEKFVLNLTVVVLAQAA